MALHDLNLLGRMPDPTDDLAETVQRVAGAIGFRRIAWKPLVCQFWIVLERAKRLDDIDASLPLALSELSAPDGRVERRCQIDVSGVWPDRMIGGESRA